jgi:hypothetical protein
VIRSLLVLRPDASKRLGGDVIQARKTAAALRELGVAADLVETDSPDAHGYDIAHLFGVFEPDVCARQMAACQAAGVPIALSTIWLDLAEFFARAPQVERALKKSNDGDAVARSLEKIRSGDLRKQFGRRGYRDFAQREMAQKSLMTRASVLLPNGAAEARGFAVRLGVREVPFVIVPNAVDYRALPAWNAARAGVVCAARIESRKNQALLVFAMRNDPIELTIVGDAYDYYGDICRKWAGPNARFVGQLDQPALFAILAGAAVHAMPSWSEGAALVSLEAAAAGARVVMGDHGSEMEYFGGEADYADPSDPQSIRAAVLRALRKPARKAADALDERIRQLNWQATAKATLRGYEIALSSA